MYCNAPSLVFAEPWDALGEESLHLHVWSSPMTACRMTGRRAQAKQSSRHESGLGGRGMRSLEAAFASGQGDSRVRRDAMSMARGMMVGVDKSM